jgi:predicted ArsR family transcriptional regulator
MQRLLTQIGRSQRLTVVYHLKRSTEGLTVAELAARLDMSYMGVKQHCVDLERDGYVDTFRRHRGVGRPELLYRLTAKAQDLFPQADNTLCLSLLEQAKRLFGAGAPEKILFLHFQTKAAEYQAAIRGESLAERARALARLRDAEGYMAEYAADPARLIERHHPMLGLAEVYPNLITMEREVIQRVLGVPVQREARQVGGAYECVYSLG